MNLLKIMNTNQFQKLEEQFTRGCQVDQIVIQSICDDQVPYDADSLRNFVRENPLKVDPVLMRALADEVARALIEEEDC